MELHEYPRPANDTGIGVHWVVGYATAVGMGVIREFWLPEMKAMGVKWVKIFNHDGAIDFAELLLAEGIMPIVRIYHPSPNPGTLSVKDIVHLDAFIRAGVRYFEFNSEPNLDSEWKGGRVPANGIDLVVDNTITNMETILERGGMPGVPALSPGSRWDLVGRIVARGRRDLFNGPVWQAIHNYPRNRPMDYPYDIGNQEGAAYTERFYRTIASEPWGEDAWRGRTLAEVNQLRLDRCSPGATIMDEPEGWLAYEYFDSRNRRHLGQSIPILSTENGYIVGEDRDPRYPATTPDLHMAQTLEASRILMGASRRFEPAPDYYFCSALWLLGNAMLGSSSDWWENHAWYSKRWPRGALPIVRALKSEPKLVRRWQGGGKIGARSVISGTVANAGPHRVLVLERAGTEFARASLDINSRYVFSDLLPGRYVLRAEQSDFSQQIDLAPGREEVILNLDFSVAASQERKSVVSGHVRGGAGCVVILLRTDDGEEWVTIVRDDGRFRFVDLPEGVYNVRVQGDGSRIEGLTLDGSITREVELAVGGWGYTVRSETNEDGIGRVHCFVEGWNDVAVQAHSGEWSSAPVQTGSAPEIGDFACEISPLDEGYYFVSVDGVTDSAGQRVSLEARARVDRKTTPNIEFVYTDPESAIQRCGSSISGHIIGGADTVTQYRALLLDDQAQRLEAAVDEEGAFVFDNLGPGLYAVAVVGHEESTSRTDIALDGSNQVNVELVIVSGMADGRTAQSHQSSIVGVAPAAAGKTARLTDEAGNELTSTVDASDSFRFEQLPAGVYRLTVEGGYLQEELRLDGENGAEVLFSPLLMTWQAKVSPAGDMPGYGVVRVEVQGKHDLPVHIWKDDWEGMTRRTGSKPEYGDHALEFGPLEPGLYMVEPEGLGVWTDVELSGLEVVWIDFHQKAVPSQKHIVRPLVDDYVDDSVDGFVDEFVPEDDDWPEVVELESGDEAESPEPVQPIIDGSLVDAGFETTQETASSEHYLYLASGVENSRDLIALLTFIEQEKPVVGSDLAAACRARRVTVLGNALADDVEIGSALRDAGVEVTWVAPEEIKHIAGLDIP